jgi:hypothetical protein
MEKKSIPLGRYVDGKIYYGIKTGFNEAFIIDEVIRQKLIIEDPKSAEIIKPFLTGKEIKKYSIKWLGKHLIFTRRGINIKEYPAILTYLSKYKVDLTPKKKTTDKQGRKPGSYKWYEIQDSIDYYKEFEKPKIIYPNICKKPEFTFDKEFFYTNQKCFIISIEDWGLLAILNSKVTYFWFKSVLPKLRGDFYEPGFVFMKNFPVPKKYDSENNLSKELIQNSREQTQLHIQLEKKRTPEEQKQVQRRIDALDDQIDRLVYKLYGLTEEEIKIVKA